MSTNVEMTDEEISLLSKEGPSEIDLIEIEAKNNLTESELLIQGVNNLLERVLG